MNQHLGALLDKLFLIFGGVVLLVVPTQVFFKSLDPKEAQKRTRMVRFCGIGMVIMGIISLLLYLHSKPN